MKTARAGIIAAAVLAVTATAWAQKPDFSGTWTLDPAASGMPAGGPGAGAPGGGGGGGRMGGGRGGILGMGPTTVKQTAGELTVESTMGGQAVTRTYKLDGSESKNTVMGRGGQSMEQVSTAKWDGGKLTLVTKQSVNDQTFETTEVWSVDGSTLTVESTSARGTQKRVYRK
jgi:hypothetical protein